MIQEMNLSLHYHGASVSDIGMYEVVVEVIHPRSGSHGTIAKLFHLNVHANSEGTKLAIVHNN